MATWKLGPALACGNTVAIKAAENTPLSILVLAKLIKEAGFPPGVVNVLNGYGKEAGAAMVQHEFVDKVAFTGSSGTASQIMEMASASLKNITLETGGKSPLLVLPDTDMEQAVRWSHMGIMSNQGQICTAMSRLLVHQDIYDEFVEKFLGLLKATSKVGNQWDDTTYQGPQVSQAQYDRIMSYIEIGKSEGATIVAGGTADNARTSAGDKGFYVQPTVFTGVKENMRVYREEIFGPVVVIANFVNEDEAVNTANNTTYGLGSAVFTDDLKRAHRVAAGIEAGMV
jgi:aldehyde dehydrogenase (NAD+)